MYSTVQFALLSNDRISIQFSLLSSLFMTVNVLQLCVQIEKNSDFF